jgi:hypothetical protein
VKAQKALWLGKSRERHDCGLNAELQRSECCYFYQSFCCVKKGVFRKARELELFALYAVRYHDPMRLCLHCIDNTAVADRGVKRGLVELGDSYW